MKIHLSVQDCQNKFVFQKVQFTIRILKNSRKCCLTVPHALTPQNLTVHRIFAANFSLTLWARGLLENRHMRIKMDQFPLFCHTNAVTLASKLKTLLKKADLKVGRKTMLFIWWNYEMIIIGLEVSVYDY